MTLALLLLALGLALIVAETLIPSFGLLGTLAGIAIVAGGYVAFRIDVDHGLTYLLVSGVLIPFSVMAGFKILPRSPLARVLMARGASFEDGRATDRRDDDLVGAEGVVEAQLRPSGVARIEGRRVDVMSRGSLVEKGTRVRVVEAAANRVVVVPLTSLETPSAPGAPDSP